MSAHPKLPLNIDPQLRFRFDHPTARAMLAAELRGPFNDVLDAMGLPELWHADDCDLDPIIDRVVAILERER